MSIYKVYSRACRSSRPVQEITEKQFQEEINNMIFNDYMNNCDTTFLQDGDGEINDDNFALFVFALDSLINDVWKNDKALECGDYAIIEAEEKPERSNMYGITYTNFTTEEIIKRMDRLRWLTKMEILNFLYMIGKKHITE